MAVFRVEKTKGYTVMSNHHLKDKNLSLKSKGLLSYMLSLPEDWDYTLRGLAYQNKESIDAIRTGILELEKFGYIRRRQTRTADGKMAASEYTIYEMPIDPEPPKPKKKPAAPRKKTEGDQNLPPCLENPISAENEDEPSSVLPILENPISVNTMSENPTQLSTYIPITDAQKTNPSNPNQSGQPPATEKVQETDVMDMDVLTALEAEIKENIDYDFLIDRCSKSRVDELVDIMLEIMCSSKKSIRISGTEFPASFVKKRFMSLDYLHFEYVLDCLDNNTTDIRNIKAYLIKTLFNAPATMDSYFTAKVNHDMHAGISS